MRVLLVNYEYPPLGGGGGILTQTLARELALSDEVTVLTSGTPDLAARSFDRGARVVRVPVVGRRERRRASAASLAAFVPSAARALRYLHPPHVVHTFFAIPSGLVGALAARRYGVPHVLTVIGADIHDPTRRFAPDVFPPLRVLVRRIVREAFAVTAISSDVAARCSALTGRMDVEVVGCGLPPRPLPAPNRARLGWREDEVVVVTTARLVRRKAIDRLVRAVSSLDEHVRLEIVGEGPERAALEALARSVGARVAFAGDVDDVDRDLRLVSADVFCQPSLHEGFGLAILEAMACGLPVVVSAAGGPCDFVEDGVHGFLVRDDGELAERLGRLVRDAPLRRRLGEAARRRAETLSAAAMAACYRRLYARVGAPV